MSRVNFLAIWGSVKKRAWNGLSLGGIRVFSASIVVGLLLLPIVSPAQNFVADPEYQSKLKKLNERYEDFYIHLDEQKRTRQQRRSQADEHKKKREQLRNSYEVKRKRFVENRSAADAQKQEALRRRWEDQMQLREKQRDKQRDLFIKKRNALSKIQESARKIPDKVETGLEDPMESTK